MDSSFPGPTSSQVAAFSSQPEPPSSQSLLDGFPLPFEVPANSVPTTPAAGNLGSLSTVLPQLSGLVNTTGSAANQNDSLDQVFGITDPEALRNLVTEVVNAPGFTDFVS